MDSGRLYEHRDGYAFLAEEQSLTLQIRLIHEAVRQRFPFITRIAAAILESAEDMASVFVFSGAENPLPHYRASLSEAPALQEMIQRQQPRVVNDLALFDEGTHEHTHRINDASGLRAGLEDGVITQGHVVYAGERRFPLTDDIDAIPAKELIMRSELLS